MSFPSPSRVPAVSRPGVRLALPVAIATLLFAGTGMAQSTEAEEEPAPTRTLEQVEVSASRIKMTEIGGHASTLRETPQSVTVIDRQQLDTQNLVNLDDVMLHTPGVTVVYNTSDEHYYYIRGQEVNSFQWDGITMESFSWLNTSPNMAMFEQVQILRGANGVLNAAKSFGSVNLIRKRPFDHLRVSGTLSYGSWNNLRVDVDVSAPLTESGRLRGRAVASYGDRDYFYDVGQRNEKLLYGILEYDLSPSTLLTVAASEHHVASVPNIYGIPLHTDGTSIGLPRSTFLGSHWNRFKAQSTNVFASVEHRLANGWQLKLAATSLDSDSAYKYSYVWGAVDPALGNARNPGTHAYGGASDWMFDQRAADLSLQGQVELFGRSHDVLVGGSYYVNYYGYGQAPLSIPSDPRGVNVRDWDPYAIPEPATPAWLYTGDGWRDDWKSLYLTTRLHLSDRWTLTTGARATWFTHQFQQYDLTRPIGSQLVTDEDTRENAILTPYAGLVWDFSRVWSLYASYADIFTPQTAQTMAGDTLKPVIGANYELGLKGELFGGRLNGSFALFRVDKLNEAMLDPRYDPNQSAFEFYLSTGKTRSSGYEIELSGRPLPAWNISGGYTRNTTEVLRADSNVGLPYANWVPKHMLRLWTDYTLPVGDGRWSVGGSLAAQNRLSRPTASPDIWMSQGGFAIIGLRVGYRLGDRWNLGLNLDNVTDRNYYARVGSSPHGIHFKGEPASATLTLRGEL